MKSGLIRSGDHFHEEQVWAVGHFLTILIAGPDRSNTARRKARTSITGKRCRNRFGFMRRNNPGSCPIGIGSTGAAIQG